MKSKTIYIFSCLAPLFLVSCMKVKSKNNSEPPAFAPTQLSESSQPNYEIIAGETPDSYTYRFPLDMKQTQLFVNRITNEGSTIESIETDSQGNWLEHKIPASEQTTYQFGFLQGKELNVVKEFIVPRPKDLIIEGLTRWPQIKEHFSADSLGQLHLKKFHRIFMKEGAVFVTEGQNLNLHMKEFFAKNAEIQTWPAGQKAMAGQAGRAGGQIFINAEKVLGKISLKLRGENGGDGIPGPVDPALNGTMGGPGVDHVVKATPTKECGVICVESFDYTCVTPATSGAQGGPGKKGLKGGTGFPGGNSGSVHFKSENKIYLVWNLEATPGLGGKGGLGGPGGEGGPGGSPGNWQVNIGGFPTPTVKVAGPCAKPLDSLKGPAGDFGDQGDPGQFGLKELSCFIEGSQPPLCL